MKKLTLFYQKYEKFINCIITLCLINVVMFKMWNKYPQHFKIICLSCILYIVVICIYFFYDKVKRIILYLIKYRYLVALIIFIFCVMFRLHGSSMDFYNTFFPMENPINSTTVIFGESRPIRSDEYRVHTPYYFSQYYNGYKKINKKMSLSGQDMIVGYNAPVKDISLIAKPLTWGYVLFGNEIGISWYWSLKLILLLLASYEISMMITKKNKKVSLLGAGLITFAPALQWWFIPHITDVFLWGMWLCILAYYFFTTKKKWLKNLITVLAPLNLTIFILALFPSCQIGVGLVVFSLFVGLLYRDKKDILFEKTDIIRIIIMVLIILLVLGYSLYTSLDAFKILSDTVYPGHRVSLGGNLGFDKLFTNLTTIFLPYKDSNVSNNCEVSDFIHFMFPFLILFPFIFKELKKKKDSNLIIGLILVVAIVIELFFMIVGFPRIIAKLTLFSYINRMNLIYGFTCVLFTLWSISALWKYPKLINNKIKIVSILLFIIGMVIIINKDNLEYASIYYYVLEIVWFAFIVCSIYMNKKILTICLVFVLLLLASATINPVSKGISAITNHRLVKEVKKISKKDDSYFLVADSVVVQNLLLANGANVINATNFYPDLKKWNLIDKEKKYENFWNRYYHLEVSLTDKNTEYKLIASDYFIINLNVKDLEKWPVKYVVDNRDISNLLEKENMKYRMKKIDNYFLYILK